MDTLLIDRETWGPCIDAAGNIAMASEPYSIVQDVASACRLFTNELWYGGNKGAPYFEQILGQSAPYAIIKEQLKRAALTVPGVLAATVYINRIEGRVITGQVQVQTSHGTQVVTL